jgi:hypothetical protein
MNSSRKHPSLLITRKFRPGVSGLIMPLIAAVFLGAVIVACGGSESPNVNGNNTEGDSQPTPTVVAAGQSETSGSDEIYVAPRALTDYPLSLNTGDVVRLHFQARSQVVGRSALGTGGSQQGDVESAVILAVTGPLGDVIYEGGEEIQEDTVDITADVAGEYVFTFINSFSLQGQSVALDYIINP